MRGDYYEAYQVYRHIAQSRPSNRTARKGLARTAPLAAAYWRDVAHLYERRDEISQAWRCYMVALLIDPADPFARVSIRELEAEAPGELALIRNAWQRYGLRALRVDAKPLPNEMAEQLDAATATHQDDADVEPTDTEGPTAAAPAGSDAKAGHAAALTARPSDDRSASATTTVTAEAYPPPSEPDESQTIQKNEVAAIPPPSKGLPEAPFLTTAIISCEDLRFGHTVELVDTIRVRLLDTDDDPDADLAIYRGKRRLRKDKNRRIGDVMFVVGQSGQRYALEILSIYDETETIRIGIRRSGHAFD
jgi:hypothetical protein